MYRAEPEIKRVAKRQRHWISSEPGCLANRVRCREAKYTLECPVHVARYNPTMRCVTMIDYALR